MTVAVKIKPLNDRVVGQANASEEKTQGGIYIPTKSDEKVCQGSVIAVGPGRYVDGKRQAIELKPGNIIVFNQYAATEVKHEGETYLVLREDDVMAIIE